MHWSKSLLSQVSKFLFRKSERIYCKLSCDEVSTLLTALSYKVNTEKEEHTSDLHNVSGIKPKFVGIVKPFFFCLSKKVSHPQSFLPRVTGRLKKKKNKTLIVLRYQLFPLTLFLLLTFLALCLCVIMLMYVRHRHPLIIILPALAGAFAYLVAKANFLMHCKDFKKVLLEELNL